MLFTLSNVNSSSILLPGEYSFLVRQLLEVQGPFEHTYNHSVYLLPQLLPLYCEHLPFEYVIIVLREKKRVVSLINKEIGLYKSNF